MKLFLPPQPLQLGGFDQVSDPVYFIVIEKLLEEMRNILRALSGHMFFCNFSINCRLLDYSKIGCNGRRETLESS